MPESFDPIAALRAAQENVGKREKEKQEEVRKKLETAAKEVVDMEEGNARLAARVAAENAKPGAYEKRYETREIEAVKPEYYSASREVSIAKQKVDELEKVIAEVEASETAQDPEVQAALQSAREALTRAKQERREKDTSLSTLGKELADTEDRHRTFGKEQDEAATDPKKFAVDNIWQAKEMVGDTGTMTKEELGKVADTERAVRNNERQKAVEQQVMDAFRAHMEEVRKRYEDLKADVEEKVKELAGFAENETKEGGALFEAVRKAEKILEKEPTFFRESRIAAGKEKAQKLLEERRAEVEQWGASAKEVSQKLKDFSTRTFYEKVEFTPTVSDTHVYKRELALGGRVGPLFSDLRAEGENLESEGAQLKKELVRFVNEQHGALSSSRSKINSLLQRFYFAKVLPKEFDLGYLD